MPVEQATHAALPQSLAATAPAAASAAPLSALPMGASSFFAAAPSLNATATGDASLDARIQLAVRGALADWAERLRSEHLRALQEQAAEFEQMRQDQVTAYTRIMEDLKAFLRGSETDLRDLRERWADDMAGSTRAMQQEIDSRIGAVESAQRTATEQAIEAAEERLRASMHTAVEQLGQQLRDDFEGRLMRLEAQLHVSFDSRLADSAAAVKRLEASVAAAKEETAWVEEQGLAARLEDEQRLAASIDSVRAQTEELGRALADELPAKLRSGAAFESDTAERFRALEARLRAEEQASVCQ